MINGSSDRGMILVRTRTPTKLVEDWSAELSRLSGLPAMMVTDRRSESQFSNIKVADAALAMTRDEDQRLGLYSPPDVGWRCGDYGFYVARARFPHVRHFWMIEDDVRLGGDAASFFAHLARFPQIDFVAADVRPAEPGWWWYSYALACDVVPWRSFFPVSRLSARAVDRLYEARRRHSHRWNRKSLWPNDEAFVATTIAASGLSLADLNALGRSFYDADTFGYTHMIDLADVPATGPAKLFHPVLPALARTQRKTRLQKAAAARVPLHRRSAMFALKQANRLTRW